MVELDLDEHGARFGRHAVALGQAPSEVQLAPVDALAPGAELEIAFEHRRDAEVDRQVRRDGGAAKQGKDSAERVVQHGRDDPTVGYPRRFLLAAVRTHSAVDSIAHGPELQSHPSRVVGSAAKAVGVMRGHPLHRLARYRTQFADRYRNMVGWWGWQDIHLFGLDLNGPDRPFMVGFNVPVGSFAVMRKRGSEKPSTSVRATASRSMSGRPAPEIADRPRARADAVRNRELVITAAREVFAEHGLGASVEAVAARAGVGKATVYRNFVTKNHLLAAVVCAQLDWFANLADEAAESDDPWHAFGQLMQAAAEAQAANRAVAGSMHGLIDTPAVEEARAAAAEAVDRLMLRAKQQGEMRADARSRDIWVLFGGVGRALTEDEQRDVAVWRRYAALIVDALRVPHDHPTPKRARPVRNGR